MRQPATHDRPEAAATGDRTARRRSGARMRPAGFLPSVPWIVLPVALVAGIPACGGTRGGGERRAGPAADLSLAAAASHGVLSYAVAFARDPEPLLVSVELAATFDLVVRSLRAGGGLAERSRIVLGPPDWDISDLALVGGGRAALVASAAGTVRLFDLESGRPLATWHLGSAATAVAVSPDARLAATGSASGVICLRRLDDGALLQCLAAHGGPVSGLDFAPDGRRLASCSWEGRAAVWSVPALAALFELRAGGSANRIAFAPDGRLAVALSGAPPQRSPDLEARERRARREARGQPVPDPRARVVVWRPGPQPNGARELRGHTGPVTAVAWTGDGRRVLSASWDRTVRLWDPEAGREVARVGGFSHLLRDLAVAGSGAWAAASAWAAGGDDPATVLLALRHSP